MRKIFLLSILSIFTLSLFLIPIVFSEIVEIIIEYGDSTTSTTTSTTTTSTTASTTTSTTSTTTITTSTTTSTTSTPTTLTTSTTTSSTTPTTTTTIPYNYSELTKRIESLEEKISTFELILDAIVKQIEIVKRVICSVQLFKGFEFCLELPTTTTTTSTTTTTTLIKWYYSTCYSKCLKRIDVSYSSCHQYWAVRNLVNRDYCNFIE